MMLWQKADVHKALDTSKGINAVLAAMPSFESFKSGLGRFDSGL
jgi:hypothetical protein